MFKINNRTVQNKRTRREFSPEKIIAQYLIRIIQREIFAKKTSRTCTIIRLGWVDVVVTLAQEDFSKERLFNKT